jgi:hypothetical protein
VVNNFEDDSRVLDGGGIMVLQPRGVGGSSIFDGGGGDISGRSSDDRGTGSNMGDWGTGTGTARLVLFLLFKCFLGLLEGLDDCFIVVGVVGVSGDCSM